MSSPDRWHRARPSRRFASHALWVLAAIVTVSPATAQARVEVSTGVNASYTVRIMSWAEIPFRSVVRQQYDFSCGSAAVATLLSFQYDHVTAERPVFAAMWRSGDRAAIRRSGFSMLDIKRYLDGIGFRTEGFRLSLARLARMQRPGIVLLNLRGYKHFVVIKGVADGTVLVGDPMLGLTRYSAAEFAAHWNGIFLTIVDSPSKRPPVYNLAADWRPWAGSALAAGRSGTSIGSLTDYLPPLYQVTPAALSDVGAAIVR